MSEPIHMFNIDEETQQFMWLHGIRRQYFYEMGGNMILYVFGYQGTNFKDDWSESSHF